MTTAALSIERFVVALVGNPNCGKTTLFNGLTGLHHKVANYPGTTIEMREGSANLEEGICATVLDLPGTYAISGTTPDEHIVEKVLNGNLVNTRPDLVIAVADATNLERNLFLVTELIDRGFKVVLAVNMMDEAKKFGFKIFDELLSRSLGIPVIPIAAKSGSGLGALKHAVVKALTHGSIVASTDARNVRLEPQNEDIRDDAKNRHVWVQSVVSRCTIRPEQSRRRHQSQIDRVLLHKVFGTLLLAGLFAAMFQAIFLWASYPMEVIGSVVEWAAASTKSQLPAGLLTDLLSDGIITGVGNVIVFVPQIVILFFFLGVLEDCGYLARAVFLLDNGMRRFGLQGRSFIPLLSSFACAIPGILSARSIPSKSDRLATIFVAPLMSCSARLPVYAVIIAAFIPNTLVAGVISLQGLVLLSLYSFGIIAACAVSWFLKKTILTKDPSFLIMEIPPLRWPTPRVVLRGVYDRAMSFIRNAMTIILACSILVWFLASHPKAPADYTGNPVQYSYAGRIGTFIEPAIKPLGFNWEIGFAILSSFPAREVFVTSLSTVYNLQEDPEDEGHSTLIANLQQRHREGRLDLATGLSLLVFYVFACQCMSTVAVVRRETNSWCWTLGMVGYMGFFAYIASLLTYQIGNYIWGA